MLIYSVDTLVLKSFSLQTNMVWDGLREGGTKGSYVFLFSKSQIHNEILIALHCARDDRGEVRGGEERGKSVTCHVIYVPT